MSQMGVFNILAAIAAGASLSPEVDLGVGVLVGVQIPANWTAANLTFEVSLDGATFSNFYSYLGAEVTFVAGVGQYLGVDPTLFRGAKAIKIRSGTSASAVNQTNAVTLNLVTALI